MKVRIVNDKAWVEVISRTKAREIYESKIFKLYFITSGLPVREADLGTKKKIGIKVNWRNDSIDYKEATALRELGYEIDLELTCRLVLKQHSGEQR